MFTNTKQAGILGNPDQCKTLFKSFLNSSKKPQICDKTEDKTSPEIEEFKKHIDSKLIELQNNLSKIMNDRMNKIENELSEKLNNILYLIEKKNQCE